MDWKEKLFIETVLPCAQELFALATHEVYLQPVLHSHIRIGAPSDSTGGSAFEPIEDELRDYMAQH